ncbi:hypothetical protein PORY_002679 [Pneumocystis oryctolagi]|uniref:Uncharacterized protein n=1 Tax=Pneumocystis oryctolagi TaxID=42067 RepID=A0ACB7C922_9ASCO|nr:hypothetical protein PORY_002679 [Pneumocystis oryctolagi]
MSVLDELRKMGTAIVMDSGDFNVIESYKPVDSTTNPSLILSAVNKPEYSKLIDIAVKYANEEACSIDLKVEIAFDRLLVEFGKEILQKIPGRVSIELDPRLSFSIQGTIEKAICIINLFENFNISKERILIKIATTWEGIQAAKILESKYGIHCNMTLIFSFCQAVACMEAGVTLISPFVGRILDYYTELTNKTYSPQEDPGVVFVTKIFNYYKQNNSNTAIMGASFRNIDEIKELAGCDYLTISPLLLEELKKSNDPITKKLDAEKSKIMEKFENISFINNESLFRWEFNEDAMASEKLRSGISKFNNDGISLRNILRARF